MAYDGITVAAVTDELNKKLSGGRVYRIAQPESDAIVLTVRAQNGQYRLLLSADASLPLVYLTDENRKNPLNAPGFCMLLRKYIQNAKILSVNQPGLERVIRIEMEHMDEMGDMRKLCLITEIMGKHSNIILTDDKDEIIDSIKRISNLVSSVREVLPGRKYFIPETRGRIDPLSVKDGRYLDMPEMANMSVHRALATYIGISNTAASEFIRVAGVDGDRIVSELDVNERESVEKIFSSVMEKIRIGDFSPVVYYHDGVPAEYAAIDTGMYPEKKTGYGMSGTLELFYREKELHVRIRQRSAELRRAVQNATERVSRKLGLQEKQCRDTEKREKNRLYGELIRAYAWQIEEGADKCVLQDYNTGEDVCISLDPTLSPQDNANKYFDKYKKQKRTYEALSVYIKQSMKALEHLESIQVALDMAQNEDDLKEIRQELYDAGYISGE
ncbi:MAG: NFACT family protein, partial [Lachnospiraceae bacterium]|nr:NFACT family protein [Lachnospiraceae bacterium]